LALEVLGLALVKVIGSEVDILGATLHDVECDDENRMGDRHCRAFGAAPGFQAPILRAQKGIALACGMSTLE
jgi:hypothetical protein